VTAIQLVKLPREVGQDVRSDRLQNLLFDLPQQTPEQRQPDEYQRVVDRHELLEERCLLQRRCLEDVYRAEDRRDIQRRPDGKSEQTSKKRHAGKSTSFHRSYAIWLF
jgi:hypothetical protein